MSALERLARLSPGQRELVFRRARERAAAEKDESITRARRDAPLVQSFAQERLWFLDRLAPGTSAYNMPECVRILGPLDLAIIERCVNEVIARHEILRTTFTLDGVLPVQTIAPSLTVKISRVDLQQVSPGEREATARRMLSSEADQPFDLAAGPLVRVAAFRLDPADHFLLVNVHHIISDGWSMYVLLSELCALYAAAVDGGAAALPELPVQYADYAMWQRRRVTAGYHDQLQQYWRKQLRGIRPLAVPTDYGRPPVQTYRGGFESVLLPRPLVDRLSAFAQENGATLFIVVLAAFKTLLHRYSGQEEISVGVPVAGRVRPELEPLIGLFANTVVMRTDFSASPSFRDVVLREREVAFGAFAHQEMPFQELVEELAADRDLSRHPLFQIMFIFQNTPPPHFAVPGLQIDLVATGSMAVKFDMLFELYETAEGVQGWIGYNADLFAPATLARLTADYLELLEAVLRSPDVRVEALAVASTRSQTDLQQFNDVL